MKNLNTSKCIPITAKTIQELAKHEPKLKICNNLTSKMNIWSYLSKEKKHCKIPCLEVQYFGRIQKWIDWGHPDILSLNIRFVSNEVKVQEQYFIYSTVDLIGIVGGNLGLFIGFSFLDSLFVICQWACTYCNTRVK